MIIPISIMTFLIGLGIGINGIQWHEARVLRHRYAGPGDSPSTNVHDLYASCNLLMDEMERNLRIEQLAHDLTYKALTQIRKSRGIDHDNLGILLEAIEQYEALRPNSRDSRTEEA